MHADLARHIGLIGLKSALGAGDYRGRAEFLRTLECRAQSLALAGLVHEKCFLLLLGSVERLNVGIEPANLRDDTAPGLLCGLLAYPVPALKLFRDALGALHDALAAEKTYLMCAGLDALLDNIIGLIALWQTAQHAHRHRGLGRALHDLDDLGLGLILIRAHKAAPVVRALPVADRHLLTRPQAKHLYMLCVAAADDRPAAEQICPKHKKSRHDKHLAKMCFLLSHTADIFSRARI